MNILKPKQNASIAGRSLRFVTATLLALSVVQGASGASAENADAEGWYATAAAGALLSPKDRGTYVKLGGGAVPIQLDGDIKYADGTALMLTVGRQFQHGEDTVDKTARRWRVEAELWHGRANRDTVDIGILQEGLDDTVRASALFLNAQYRLAATTRTRWWLGAGVGYARLRVPDASKVANCSCLGSADGAGQAGRIKLAVEYTLGPRVDAFLQLGYVALPDARTREIEGALTRHSALRSGEGAIGIRLRW